MFIHPTKLQPNAEETVMLNHLAWRYNILLCPPTLEQLGSRIGKSPDVTGRLVASMEVKGFVEQDFRAERGTKITNRGLGFVPQGMVI